MTWLPLTLISVAANICLSLCFRRLQKNYAIGLYLFIVWIITGGFLLVVYLPMTQLNISLIILVLLGLAGFASWLGNYAFNLSLHLQPNIGYIEALASIRIAITYLISIAFLGAIFEPRRLIGLIGITIGILLVTNFRIPTTIETSKNGWTRWALLSGVMFALLAIFSKLVFNTGLAVPLGTALFILFAASFYGGTLVAKKEHFHIRGNIPLLLITGVIAVLANLTSFAAYANAPNVAYPVAVSSTRIIILYVLALVTGNDKFDLKKALGTFLTCGAIVFLA